VNTTLLWVGFNLFILAMLALDLLVFHRRSHAIRFRESLIWSGVWISLALLFCVGVYYFRGQQVALEFLTGYLIEESLSVDNLFVFLLIFSYFRVPPEYQHKVLFWGILGALVMRLTFILLGVALLERFHWLIYVFGGVLIISGVRMAFDKDKEIDPEVNPVLRLFRRFFPVSPRYEGDKFFIKTASGLLATPLFVVLLVVETTDVVFAVDSVPAVLAITQDPFIVYTSNAFAILGLRTLYFALAHVMRLFHWLHYGLSAILVFVGLKMVLADVIHVPTPIALAVVAGLLAMSVVASMLWPRPVELPVAPPEVAPDGGVPLEPKGSADRGHPTREEERASEERISG
jgi:tellurite resistance protein TerC